MSRKDFAAIRAMAKARKEKREVKRETLPWAGKKKRRGKSSRRIAFDTLKANCVTFVLLRAKFRTGGRCEVGMACHGLGRIELWYHFTPQAMGNALKYDDRNICGSCSSCNGGEYFARKRGSDAYEARHRVMLGPLYDALKAMAGRRQISTSEALAMADAFHLRIERGEWREGQASQSLPAST